MFFTLIRLPTGAVQRIDSDAELVNCNYKVMTVPAATPDLLKQHEHDYPCNYVYGRLAVIDAFCVAQWGAKCDGVCLRTKWKLLSFFVRAGFRLQDLFQLKCSLRC